MSEAEIEVFLLSYIKNSNIITISNILNSDRNGLTEVMHIIWQVKPKIKKKEKESSKKKKVLCWAVTARLYLLSFLEEALPMGIAHIFTSFSLGDLLE